MARVRDPARDEAKKIFLDSDGQITNREIANTLGVDEKKIATWKSRDNWNECSSENVVQQNKKCSTTKVKEEKKELKKNEKSVEISNTELTEKQRLFCIYYIQSFNATQSAIKAGYSRDSSFVEGNRLLKNAKVKKYLNELKELYANESYLETKRIIERHTQIAFADMKDYLSENSNNFKLLSQTDGTLIKKVTFKESENSQGYTSSISLELEDRNKSLEFLTKFMGLDPKTEIERERLEIEKNKNTLNEEEGENNNLVIEVIRRERT